MWYFYTVISGKARRDYFQRSKRMRNIQPWRPPTHPSLPSAPGWCGGGFEEPPLIALETDTEIRSGVNKEKEEDETALTLIHGWFMNSVMVILCVGSVLSRVLMSCLAAKTFIKILIIYLKAGVSNARSLNMKLIRKWKYTMLSKQNKKMNFNPPTAGPNLSHFLTFFWHLWPFRVGKLILAHPNPLLHSRRDG